MPLSSKATAGPTVLVGICLFCAVIGARAVSADAKSQAPHPSAAAQTSDPAAQEAALRRAARLRPNDPQVLARLGTALAMQNKLPESVVWLEKALKLDPRDGDSRRTLATIYWQLGELQKAATNLKVVLSAKPEDAWSTLLLGMISEDLGNHAQCVQFLSRVMPRVRQRPEPILALARAYYQLKETAKAQQTLQYLSELPDNSAPVFSGGRAAAEFHDYATAEALFRTIQYTYPNPGEIQFNLALAQYSQKHFDESQRTLLNSVESGHATANAYELLGWTYQEQDKLEDMMKAFEKAINMEPDQESHFLELGQALLEKRNSQTALDVAMEALKRFPSSSRVYSMKGAAELRMSRLSEAVESYTKATELDPKDPKAALGLALTYWNANQDAKAASLFAEYSQKFPDSALIQMKYAIFLMNAPEERTAEQEAKIKALFLRSEQLDDSISETHFNLGNIALKEERYEDALRELRRADELDPEMSKTHYALAKLYRRLGKLDDAARETEIQKKLKEKEDRMSEPNAGRNTVHQ